MTTASLVRDLLAFSVQITVVALAIALLLKVVRIPATARYLGLRLALVASLTVPWLMRAPEVQAPARAPEVIQPTQKPRAAVAGSAVPAAQGSEPVESMPIPWMRLGLGALLMGALARIVWLAVGVRRLMKLKRHGVIVDEPEYSELQARLGTSAAITQVEGLSQPATFGVRRPVVLLPDTLAAAPSSLRRAVVTHELFHVRRRDWLGLVAEEMVRTALWFHPAVLWLTSQIQLAREEIVDELTVRATGDRRTYVEALLAFADTPGLSPAPGFAHRRQLFHRILSVSKEKAMSTPRMASSVAVLVLAVAGASWYASTLFPIVKAAAKEEVQAPTARADRVNVSLQDSKVVLSDNVELVSDGTSVRASKMVLELAPQTTNAAAPRAVTPENPIPRRTRGVSPIWPRELSGRQIQVVVSALVAVDRDGRVTAVSRDGCSVAGDGEDVCQAFFDATAAAIRQWQYDRPSQGPIHFYVNVTYRPGVEPTVTQSAESLATYTRETVRNRLLAERDRETTAALLRAQAESMRASVDELISELRELERAHRLARGNSGGPNSDLVELQQRLAQLNAQIASAERRLRGANEISADLEGLRRAMEIVRAAEAQVRALQAEATRAAQVDRVRALAERGLIAPADAERLSPQGANARPLVAPSGRTPIRLADVPGLKAPTVTKRVSPQYSPVAMQARVQGTVVLEVLVDEQGRVPDARVIRSVPLLDQAALDAAKQWEFTPTILNGAPVPVLVQLELEFNLRN